MSAVLVLSATDVHSVFDLRTAIASQRTAFAALGRGEALLAPRLLLPERGDDLAFCYVAGLPGAGAVAKFGSVRPGNAARGLPSVSALVVALDPVDGRPAAIVEGTSVTTLRTSAASAVAIDHLAVPGASRLAVIGAGVQGRAHLRAVAAVRPLRRVRLFSRDPSACAVTAAELSRELDLPVRAAATAREAVVGSDIVITCTTSKEPVVHGTWIDQGCTVVSVGSFAPGHREVDTALLTRAAAVVVDDVATAREQAGPVIAALREGDLEPADLLSLGDVVTGRSPARHSPDDIVFYNSVGLGIQDAAAIDRIITIARRTGAGRLIHL